MLQKGTEVPLVPLTEYVGKIIKVTENRITLEAKWNLSIMINSRIMKGSKKLLRKDAHVGIIVLEDGSIRVRRLSDVAGKHIEAGNESSRFLIAG